MKCKWQTHGCGDLLQNLKYILQNQFGHKLPDLPTDIIKISFSWEVFNITLLLTKPMLDGKRTYLTKKTFHAYLNHRPIIT